MNNEEQVKDKEKTVQKTRTIDKTGNRRE